MRIVFLDSATVQKGDLDRSLFSDLGEIDMWDSSSPEEIGERIASADIVVTNKVRLERQHFGQCQNLKLVCILATGYDIIDLAAAGEQVVVVCNVPGYSSDSVAQTTFALLLELTHGIGQHNQAVHAGEWTSSPTFSFWKQPLVELAGKIFVVVGYGAIGKKVADIANAFGMKVIVTSLRARSHDSSYEQLPLEDALAQADVVSLHCPLTDENRAMFDRRVLEQMKPSAFLVNTARGGLVQEQDLADVLQAGLIAGYACDVLSTEPPSSSNPLLSAPRCIISPHLAWASLEARQRLWKTCADNIRAFMAGNPQNTI